VARLMKSMAPSFWQVLILCKRRKFPASGKTVETSVVSA
jgi:hypothetical protein